MAAVPVAITNAVIVDKWNRVIHTGVAVYGEMVRSDVGIGGGPIIPPDGEKPPGDKPPGFWGPGDPFPTPPIAFPPGWVGGVPPVTPPLPPEVTPPSPGDPTTPMPPPTGSAGWPVPPITPPPYIVVNYPGIGPVIVAPPAPSTPQT